MQKLTADVKMEQIQKEMIELLLSQPDKLLRGYCTQFFHTKCGKTIERAMVDKLKEQDKFENIGSKFQFLHR
jgi:hypothetical protein